LLVDRHFSVLLLSEEEFSILTLQNFRTRFKLKYAVRFSFVEEVGAAIPRLNDKIGESLMIGLSRLHFVGDLGVTHSQKRYWPSGRSCMGR